MEQAVKRIKGVAEIGTTKNANLTLKDRRWTCEGCGTILDRDTNAAINIREAGLSLLTA